MKIGFMILVADSGSTKSKWAAWTPQETFYYDAPGINPVYQSDSEIFEIVHSVKAFLNEKKLKADQIYFYSAGCGLPEYQTRVQNLLKSTLEGETIEVQSDLLGAARGLFGKKEGIACILGTGSNTGYCRNGNIVTSVSPLGLYLGDEGSGGNLGRKLLRNFLRNQLPLALAEDLKEFCPGVDASEVLRRVYKENFPNRYLASFAPFLREHIGNLEIRKLVESSFEEYFSSCIDPFPEGKGLPLGFVGSVAFEFEDQLREAAGKKGYIVDLIERNPIRGLIDYHTYVLFYK